MAIPTVTVKETEATKKTKGTREDNVSKLLENSADTKVNYKNKKDEQSKEMLDCESNIKGDD